MGRILCITSGLSGILNASYEIAHRLQTANYQVIIASPAPVGEKVVAQGFDYRQLPPVNFFPCPPLPDFHGPLIKLKRFWFRLKNGSRLRKISQHSLHMPEFEKILLELKPDFILVDIELHEHIFTIFSLGVPFSLLSQWFSLWKRPGLPPLLHDTIPGVGWRGSKIGMEWAWVQVKIWRWWVFNKKRILYAGTDRRTTLKNYARQVGFPLHFIRQNFWPGPFSYSTLPVITITAQEMEFPHDIRPSMYYVGPMVYSNRRELQEDGVIKQKLENIFQRKLEEGLSLIYASVSSFSLGDVAFLQRLIKAVEPKKKWILVIALAGRIKVEELGPLPGNVYPFSWIPQLLVLRHADCSINHGGIHTIHECLYYQVPMIVYSGKTSDQNGCAARVHFHGLGIMADKDKDTTMDIRHNIEKILGEPAYKKKSQQFFEKCRRYHDENILAETIGQLLASR